LQHVLTDKVLVIDELGAVLPTEWAQEKISLMINERYYFERTTLITTNYPVVEADRVENEEVTLGDSIRDRLVSRIRHMRKVADLTK